MPAELLSAIDELAVLRDALVHNHVWEVDFKWGDGGEGSIAKLNLTPGFGDQKHPAFTDRSLHLTQGPLQLELVPTRLTRDEVLIVLGVIGAVLLRLESKIGPCMVSLSDFRVDVRTDRMAQRVSVPFFDWLSMNIQDHSKRANELLRRVGAMPQASGFDTTGMT
jgi:hypothetical protein